MIRIMIVNKVSMTIKVFAIDTIPMSYNGNDMGNGDENNADKTDIFEFR